MMMSGGLSLPFSNMPMSLSSIIPSQVGRGVSPGSPGLEDSSYAQLSMMLSSHNRFEILQQMQQAMERCQNQTNALYALQDAGVGNPNDVRNAVQNVLNQIEFSQRNWTSSTPQQPNEARTRHAFS